MNKLTHKVFENCPPGVCWAGVRSDGKGIYFYTKKKPVIENSKRFVSNWYDWSYILDASGNIIEFDAFDWENSVVYRWPRKKRESILTQEIFERPDCPEWAKYAALDSNGALYYYETKPFPTSSMFDYDRKFECSIGAWFPANRKWRDSLIKRKVNVQSQKKKAVAQKKKVNKIEEKEPVEKPYKPEILFLVFLFSAIVILICYFLMKMNLFNPFDI